MTKIIQLIVLLVIVVVLAICEATTLKDYRIPLASTSEKPKNCTTPGLLCETCQDLVACILNENNTFSKTNVQTCSSGQKCLKTSCVSDPDPVCDGTADLAFPCTEVGIFPDPFYCNKFVLCVNINGKVTAYPNKCEEGLGYNIGTGLCDIKLENGICKEDDYPLPLCEKAAQSEALKDKPQEYYTCEQYSKAKEVLYPVINVCPHGETYENFKCGN